MADLLKFTDYYTDGADWFIRQIQSEINLRDIPGVTNSRMDAINVTGEHPLVQLVGNLVDPQSQVSFAGLLPTIAVVENSEDEEFTTIGQGKRVSGQVTQAFVTDVRDNYARMDNRNQEGIVTDAQLDALEAALTGGKTLFVTIEEFMFRESVFVSLWAHTLEEKKVLGFVLRSILIDLRKAMLAAHLTDIHIRTSKGLTNFNFGKLLRGQETEITYINTVRNFTVTDEEVKDLAVITVTTMGRYKNTVDTTHVDIYGRTP